jgi:diguanylate cyclase (GGDEF)-like protein
MLDALVTPQVFGRYSVNLSCSIGIALYPGDGADIQALLARADTAMYAVKGAGRNGYRFAGDIPAGT